MQFLAATVCHTRNLRPQKIEARGWVTPSRGLHAIHASNLIMPEYQIAAMSEPIKSLFHKEGYNSWKDLPTGALLGRVVLEDIFPTNLSS